MNVHYLQHVPFEGLGYIRTWLDENGHHLSGTHFFEEKYTLPGLAAIDALVVMGGPMSVYDDGRYPWLREEIAFIRDCIRSGKKVLGVCLGAQLIALCLGAEVYAAPHKEIGWYPVTPTAEAIRVEWFYSLFQENPTVFHWHGDQFGIPDDGSVNLLFSEANGNQVIYHNQDVIGLQFHLEVTPQSVQQMLENAGNELADMPYVQMKETIEQGITHISHCNDIMNALLMNWLDA